MSIHSEVMATVGVPVLMETLGTPVIYHAGAGRPGPSVSLTGIITPVRVDDFDIEDGIEQPRVCEVILSIGDNSVLPQGAILDPAMDAEIEIDSERWAIHAIQSLSATVVRVTVTRPMTVEKSRPGYRRS